MLILIAIFCLFSTSSALTWNSCKDFDEKNLECAVVQVPLDYENLKGATYELSVMRVTKGDSDAQVWELADFGESSIKSFGSELVALSERYNSDVYACEIRGYNFFSQTVPTFYAEPSDLKVVYDSLSKEKKEELKQITTTNAAKDIYYILKHILQTKQRIFLNAHGYGTYLANRVVQLFPQLVEAVVSDGSIFGPHGYALDTSISKKKWFLRLLGKCEEDSFCVTRLTNESASYAEETFELLENGYCDEIVESVGGLEILKWSLENTFYSNNLDDIVLGPILVYRIRRCDWTDRLFFENVFSYESGVINLKKIYDDVTNTKTIDIKDQPKNQTNNLFLHYHLQSEMGRNPIPTRKEIIDLMNDEGSYGFYNLSKTEVLYHSKSGSQFWPWPNSEHDSRYPASNKTKWFLISGELDYETPLYISEDIASNLQSNSLLAHLIVPNARHLAGRYSTCGRNATRLFFSSRGKVFSSSCLVNETFSWLGNPSLLARLNYKHTYNLWIVAFQYSGFILMTSLVVGIFITLIVVSGGIIFILYKRRLSWDVESSADDILAKERLLNDEGHIQ